MSRSQPRFGMPTALLLSAALLGFGLGQSFARDTVASLLDTGETVLGQPLAYPRAEPARVVSVIVTMLPGEATGWHRHDVPMFGFILEGEVTVDYGARGTRTYRQGEAVMEAVDIAHNGRNTGTVPARILAVFLGAEGIPNTVPLPAPGP